MLAAGLREQLFAKISRGDDAKVATAKSFAYEWRHFAERQAEWEANFLSYMAPHGPEFFVDKRLLDAGCGSGRHAYYSAKFGAAVWAMDLGLAVETAAANNREWERVHVVQADIMGPPFERESFDFVYSLGVLHHLSEPEAAFRRLLEYVKPGGAIQIFLYWKPEGQPIKAALLYLVSFVRMLTTRIPYRLLHALSYLFAALAFVFLVWPYRLFKRIPGLARLAEKMPMKQYSLYPFIVCVNDQFDRFSAPIENRYTRLEVAAWLERAGLEETFVRPNFGWCAGGRKPLRKEVNP